LIYKAFLKAKAFYRDLTEGNDRKINVNDYKMDIDIFESEEEEEEEEEKEEEKEEIERESTEY